MAFSNQELLQTIIHRLDSMAGRMSSLEGKVTSLQKQANAQEESISYQIAEELSSVVGLKEALTCRRNSIKYIWMTLFVLGIAATAYYIYKTTQEFLSNPTATDVELRRPPAYNYPYLAVCTWAWLDVDKATSRGLTMDAIKYSMAYVDEMIIDESVDMDNGRKTFIDFYKKHNYTSLLEYYKDMATDLVDLSNESYAMFADSNDSCFTCYGCDPDEPMEKVAIDNSMCYAFKFSPVDTKHYHGLMMPDVLLKLQDKTRTTFGMSSNFRIFLTPDKNLTQPNFPPIAMEAVTSMTLKTTPQTFISLPDEKHPCITAEKAAPDYSSERCLVKCLSEHQRDHFNCYFFSYAANDRLAHPWEYCNYNEILPGTNMTVYEVVEENGTAIIEDGGTHCMRQCPYACNRTIHSSTLHSKFPIKQSAAGTLEKIVVQNMTFIEIIVHHSAVSVGGMVTFAEISTFSLTTLVSNVGGTLGLFVGGTVFTFLQLIMFCVNYLLDMKERKNAVHPTSGKAALGEGEREGTNFTTMSSAYLPS